MAFERTTETKIIEVIVIDSDLISDDVIGLGIIDIVELCGD